MLSNDELAMIAGRPDARLGKTGAQILKFLGAAGGDLHAALGLARAGGPRTAAAHEAIRMASVGANTAEGDQSLVGQPQNTDLLSFVRPRELIGRLPLRPVPFDVNLVATTQGTSAAWAGEGKPAPLSRPVYSRKALKLPLLKLIAMAVESEELLKSADVDAEVTVGMDFTRARIAASDSAFVDPSNAGVANVRPASVTFGAPAFASSGVTAAALDNDGGQMIESLIDGGSDLLNAFFIMHPLLAAFLSRLLNAAGARAYPNLTVKGGEFLGLPALTSASVPMIGSPKQTSLILLDASRVWIARDDSIALEASRQATIEMLDNPTNDSATPTHTTQVSMFQAGAVALRGTQFVNWSIDEATSCAVLNNILF